MIEFLKQVDTAIFLFLNSFHNSFWDFVMYWASDKFIWVPLYAVLVFFLFRYYGRKTWWILLFAAIFVFLSDQASVHLFKNLFQRLRPCHELGLQGLAHIVNGKCGGHYGFVSSHASNTFGLAVFLIPFFRKKWKYFPMLILLWAGLVSYSRIYLGVHYPGDILFGALLGIGIGIALLVIYFRSGFLK